MASILSAGTTNSTALNLTADNSGSLILASNNNVTAVTIDANQNATFASSVNAPNTFGFKNRIINGAMVIDQRNAGASITASTSALFSVDRWQTYSSPSSKFTVQQTPSATETGYATRVGAGFTNYLACTSSSAYTVTASDLFFVQQTIEGFNTADLAFGTANAKSVTISFLVYSSLTGSFGASLQNGANNRSYPFSYTISSANTWTQINVTIAGDTGGTWVGASNAGSMIIVFSLGMGSTKSGTANAWVAGDYRSVTGATSVVGTNGATFYITGVQLETGTKATSFDYRPYGTELSLCQRYFYRYTALVNSVIGRGYNTTGNVVMTRFSFPVTMRANPTATLVGTFATVNTATVSIVEYDTSGVSIGLTVSSSGDAYFYASASSQYFTAESEL